MKYKKWSPEIWSKIEKALELALKEEKHPIAAFDADGTLWDTDLGENFFKFQIKNKLLTGLPEKPWEYYRQWKESGDPRPAYLWLAQINKGHKIEDVRKWAEDSVRQFQNLPIFEDQVRLIEKFQRAGAEVFIVTASVRWAVEPGAIRIGVPVENVIGVTTKIKNGLISDEQDGEMTYREGKAAALLKQTNNKRPFFCSGNTMGDLHLMTCSKGLAMAVGAAKEPHELFATEERLRQEALARNWLIHQF